MAIEDEQILCKMVVIDTDGQAGNFERQLTAFLTGRAGDCGVGSQIATFAAGEMRHADWWEENSSPQEDIEGSEFFRPCTIWRAAPLPGQRPDRAPYSSVAIFVESFPEGHVLEELLERAERFCSDPAAAVAGAGRIFDSVPDKPIGFLGARLVEPLTCEIQVPVTRVSGYSERKAKP